MVTKHGDRGGSSVQNLSFSVQLMDTMASQDGLKTIALPLFIMNIFVMCHDFSLVDSVET